MGKAYVGRSYVECRMSNVVCRMSNVVCREFSIKNVDKPILRIYHSAMPNRRGMSLIEVVISMLILAICGLAVTATVALLNSAQMRSAGGSSLDLQALNYARETLESLKNAVSSDATRAAPLTIGVHNDATTALPACVAGVGACNLLNHGGMRTYTVANVPGTDLRSVTVCVAWSPDACP